MPEAKKKKRSYESQVDSQVSGLRLVRQQRAPAPQPGEVPGPFADAGSVLEPQPTEPELVSKLIQFIKTI